MLLSVPCLINYLYILGKTNAIIKTVFDASDALSFYGSFLAFIGTVFLGALALWQNKQIQRVQEHNDKIKYSSMIQVKKEFSDNQSANLIKGAKFEYEKEKDLAAAIINLSDIFLNEIRIRFEKGDFRAPLSLAYKEEKLVLIPIPRNEVANICEIEFKSCYGITTYGTLTLISDDNMDFSSEKDARIGEYKFHGINKPRRVYR